MVRAGVCGSVCAGFDLWVLQGAWPFGLVEGVWSVIAVRRWLQLGRPEKVVADAGRSEDTAGTAEVPLG